MTTHRFYYRTVLLSALVACTGTRDGAAAIPPAYRVTDLGTLGGSNSAANGINASGQVAGRSTTIGDEATHPFLWTPTTTNGAAGTMIDLGTLGGTSIGGFGVSGWGVNDSGHVAGLSFTSGNAEVHAFLYDGTMHDLGTLGGNTSWGHGINDSGQVTGLSTRTGDAAEHAFLWTPTTPNGSNGTMIGLGTLGGTHSSGWDVNAAGQVTGWSSTAEEREHAFLYDGTMHDLGTLGGTHSSALAISESGQVVGHSHTAGDGARHAFLWTPTAPNGASGTMIDLGTLGGTGSFGRDVNASSQVVGQSFIADNLDRHAFLYTADSGMVDLNSLIDSLSGWTLTFATAINDAGQIAGFGQIGGQEHAFLLTPVPEPASLALLALGLPLLVWRNSRRSGRGGDCGLIQHDRDAGDTLITKYRSVYRTIVLLALVACSGIAKEAAAIPPAYTVTGLGSLGGTYSVGLGINANGQVAGYSQTTGDFAYHAFLWTPTTPNGVSGTLHDLGTLGGTDSYGWGINASGQVAGYSQTTGDAGPHAFLYDGTMHDLGTLGGTSSYAYAINASGQVVGNSQTTGDAGPHAFLYDGTMHDLGIGGTSSYAYGINASGQVTGEFAIGNAIHAFLYDGTMHDLGTFGGHYSFGYGINDSGQVTGASSTTDDLSTLPFLYDGRLHSLESLGGTESYGLSINASGQVVGTSYPTGNPAIHAFLYTSGSGMVDLNSLIDPLSGWELGYARAINDAGQITGWGFIGGQQSAFLLTPVPEPASLALVALGLPLLVWRNSRRSVTGGLRGAHRPMTVLLKL